ncbi:Beta-barrel assembly-enhancing protease [Tepidimonas alkaliphilus]|uniref:Beta-barrel assembly-enhancing protease n=1 Tax=Tepidimonas alkaliphilus TaxID=2588942 RepID=A0A554WAD9_9BURK|nr:tetratricopeptide repeat protein [Tepidimonas alkaliphilus]TSE20530.1 Beta-barrel assembly-enhancing protease [Tepidimonas alkaliphilus]
MMLSVTRAWKLSCLALGAACAWASAWASTPEAALAAYRSGKSTQALSMLEEQLAANPKDPQLLLLKGVILAETGRSKDARTIFQNLIVDHPQLPEPYNNLAVLYAADGDFDKARAVLEMAIKTNPSYATAYENLGDIYAKLASQSYARALNLQPKKELQPKLRLINQVVALTPAATAPAAAAAPASASGSSAAAAPAANPPTPAPAPTAKPTSPTSGDNVEQAVREALEQWRRAWSARDIQAYVESYVPRYTPKNGMSHEQWVNERTARIVPRKRIEVELSDVQIQPRNDGSVAVRFVQQYRSDSLDNRTRKELVLTQQGGRWLIASERTL